MPASDSNISFLVLIILITGIGVVALSRNEGSPATQDHGVERAPNNSLYEASDTWRASLKVRLNGGRAPNGDRYPKRYPE
jgi:hypothetical protein